MGKLGLTEIIVLILFFAPPILFTRIVYKRLFGLVQMEKQKNAKKFLILSSILQWIIFVCLILITPLFSKNESIGLLFLIILYILTFFTPHLLFFKRFIPLWNKQQFKKAIMQLIKLSLVLIVLIPFLCLIPFIILDTLSNRRGSSGLSVSNFDGIILIIGLLLIAIGLWIIARKKIITYLDKHI